MRLTLGRKLQPRSESKADMVNCFDWAYEYRNMVGLGCTAKRSSARKEGNE